MKQRQFPAMAPRGTLTLEQGAHAHRGTPIRGPSAPPPLYLLLLQFHGISLSLLPLFPRLMTSEHGLCVRVGACMWLFCVVTLCCVVRCVRVCARCRQCEMNFTHTITSALLCILSVIYWDLFLYVILCMLLYSVL